MTAAANMGEIKAEVDWTRDATAGRTSAMKASVVREHLDRLKEHGFIFDWEQDGGRWWVGWPGAYRWYSLTQIGAFIDGAMAMGAA